MLRSDNEEEATVMTPLLSSFPLLEHLMAFWPHVDAEIRFSVDKRHNQDFVRPSKRPVNPRSSSGIDAGNDRKQLLRSKS